MDPKVNGGTVTGGASMHRAELISQCVSYGILIFEPFECYLLTWNKILKSKFRAYTYALNSYLENMKQSSCFGHVKGEHPCRDWAGRWLNGLGGEGRVWLEIQSLEPLACGGTHVIELNRTYRSKCRWRPRLSTGELKHHWLGAIASK